MTASAELTFTSPFLVADVGTRSAISNFESYQAALSSL